MTHILCCNLLKCISTTLWVILLVWLKLLFCYFTQVYTTLIVTLLALRQSGRIEIFLSPIIASQQTDPCICMFVHVHKHCKTQNTWQVSEWVLDNVAPKTLPTTSGLQTWLHKQPPIYPTCISTTVTVCSGRGELPVRVRYVHRRWWWRWSCL